MTRKDKIIVGLIGLLACIFLSVAAFFWKQINTIPPSKYADVHAAFSLKSDTGVVNLNQSKGRIALVYFGFLKCPDVCPATLQNIAKVLDQLSPEEQAKVDVYFITLDPERDSDPVAVGKYARHFHPKIVGLTGDLKQIEAAAKSFMIGFRKEQKPNSAIGYTISHTSYIFVMRHDGLIGDFVAHDEKPEVITRTVRRWLKWID